MRGGDAVDDVAGRDERDDLPGDSDDDGTAVAEGGGGQARGADPSTQHEPAERERPDHRSGAGRTPGEQRVEERREYEDRDGTRDLGPAVGGGVESVGRHHQRQRGEQRADRNQRQEAGQPQQPQPQVCECLPVLAALGANCGRSAGKYEEDEGGHHGAHSAVGPEQERDASPAGECAADGPRGGGARVCGEVTPAVGLRAPRLVRNDVRHHRGDNRPRGVVDGAGHRRGRGQGKRGVQVGQCGEAGRGQQHGADEGGAAADAVGQPAAHYLPHQPAATERGQYDACRRRRQAQAVEAVGQERVDEASGARGERGQKQGPDERWPAGRNWSGGGSGGGGDSNGEGGHEQLQAAAGDVSMGRWRWKGVREGVPPGDDGTPGEAEYARRGGGDMRARAGRTAVSASARSGRGTAGRESS